MNEKEGREEYLRERELLTKLEAEAYRSFDRTLLTLSSGVIVLSVALLDKLHSIYSTCLLISSWALLLISIILQLVSLIINPKAIREEIVILGERYENNYEGEARKNKYTGISTILNYISLTVFIFGTILFLVLAIINVNYMF